ncbi:MAG: hypothetical protein IJW65_01795 [Clostridia bacterium]|nr:hypothetical protein [Clostridia bacterium]
MRKIYVFLTVLLVSLTVFSSGCDKPDPDKSPEPESPRPERFYPTGLEDYEISTEAGGIYEYYKEPSVLCEDGRLIGDEEKQSWYDDIHKTLKTIFEGKMEPPDDVYEYMNGAHDGVAFAILDITGDGIPELLQCAGKQTQTRKGWYTWTEYRVNVYDIQNQIFMDAITVNSHNEYTYGRWSIYRKKDSGALQNIIEQTDPNDGLRYTISYLRIDYDESGYVFYHMIGRALREFEGNEYYANERGKLEMIDKGYAFYRGWSRREMTREEFETLFVNLATEYDYYGDVEFVERKDIEGDRSLSNEELASEIAAALLSTSQKFPVAELSDGQ